MNLPLIASQNAHTANSWNAQSANLDYALSKAKTVAKSGYFHGEDNVILIFRSMEILIDCYEDENLLNKKKSFSPIYIPVDVVRKLYRFSTKELIKILFDHVSFTKTSSIKFDLNKLRNYLVDCVKQNMKEFVPLESGVIKTSYMYQDCDYNVTIKYPYLEYHNSYKSLVVIRPLITEEDYSLFFKSLLLLSTEWPTSALKCFTSYSQFNMLTGNKKVNPSLGQFSSPVKHMKSIPMLANSKDEE